MYVYVFVCVCCFMHSRLLICGSSYFQNLLLVHTDINTLEKFNFFCQNYDTFPVSRYCRLFLYIFIVI